MKLFFVFVFIFNQLCFLYGGGKDQQSFRGQNLDKRASLTLASNQKVPQEEINTLLLPLPLMRIVIGYIGYNNLGNLRFLNPWLSAIPSRKEYAIGNAEFFAHGKGLAHLRTQLNEAHYREIALSCAINAGDSAILWLGENAWKVGSLSLGIFGLKRPLDSLNLKAFLGFFPRTLEALRITHDPSNPRKIPVRDHFLLPSPRRVSILEKFGNLKVLELCGLSLGQYNLDLFAKTLLSMSQLEELGLAKNNIPPAGMEVIAKVGLRNKPRLRDLNLSGNALSFSGAKALAQNMSPQLRRLNISRCHITPTAIRGLGFGLAKTHYLQILNLSGNPQGWGIHGVRALVDKVLPRLPNLRILALSNKAIAREERFKILQFFWDKFQKRWFYNPQSGTYVRSRNASSKDVKRAALL